MKKHLNFVAITTTIILLLFLLLSGSFIGEVSAEELSSDSEINYKFISQNKANQIAKTFLKNFSITEYNVESNIPIYNIDETIFGYEIEFEKSAPLDSIIIRDTLNEKLLIHKFSLKKEKNNEAKVNFSSERNLKKYLISFF